MGGGSRRNFRIDVFLLIECGDFIQATVLALYVFKTRPLATSETGQMATQEAEERVADILDCGFAFCGDCCRHYGADDEF